jgi:hypothetical protein
VKFAEPVSEEAQENFGAMVDDEVQDDKVIDINDIPDTPEVQNNEEENNNDDLISEEVEGTPVEIPEEEPSIDEVEVSIELPESTGNYLQDENTKILVTVEAVQGNASVSGTEEVSYFATNVNELKELLMNKENVVLASDVDFGDLGTNPTAVAVFG